MSHNHAHHGHSHAHAPKDFTSAFRIGIILNVAFVVIEAVYGLFSGSLALLADAGHNLSDVLGLALAWGAAVLAKRPSTRRRTYGMKRGTIMAALLNALLLMVAVGGIAWEAIRRFSNPEPVAGMTVIIVAGIGVVINTVTALLFMSGRDHDLNVKGAFLHMAADALVSIAVVIGGMIILWTGWYAIDPILSLLIVAVVTWGTWGLFRESLNLVLDGVPEKIDTEEVKNYLTCIPGIEGVHHLHIWGMSTTETALTAHLVKPQTEGDDQLLKQIAHELHDHFDIEHTTIQWERDGKGCDNGCE